MNRLLASTVACVALLTGWKTVCAAEFRPPREINVSSESPAGWAPSVELERQAREAVSAYLAAIDEGRFSTARAFMSPRMQNSDPREVFEERSAKFRTLAGTLRERRTIKETWSKDPASAGELGVYVVFDLVSQFANIDRHCGYIALHQAADGQPFKVSTVVEAYVDNATAQSIVRRQSAAELDDVWYRAASICPNYPLPESHASTVGYPTVAAALVSLRGNRDITFKEDAGWTIAVDLTNRTIWSFTPSDHPAHPAVVKRQVVAKGSGAALEMKILCEGAKPRCDDLVRSFQQLNDATLSGRSHR